MGLICRMCACSRQDLLLPGFFVLMMVMFFASLLWVVERDTFPSIPWAVTGNPTLFAVLASRPQSHSLHWVCACADVFRHS